MTSGPSTSSTQKIPPFGGTDPSGVTAYGASFNPTTGGYATPCVLVGREVSVVVGGAWINCNNNSNEYGTSVVGPGLGMYGTLDAISWEYDVRLEDISPMNIPSTNAVPIEASASMEITEILTSNGGILLYLTQFFSYIAVSIQRGESGVSYLGAISGYTEGLRKGKSIGRMTLRNVILDGAASIQTYYGGFNVGSDITTYSVQNASVPSTTFYTFPLNGSGGP